MVDTSPDFRITDGSGPVTVDGTVIVDDGGGSITVDAVSLPLPTGAATSANQVTQSASLASIDAGIPAALGQAAMAASMPVAIASNQSTLPISAASLPLPAGAATAANQATEIAALISIDAGIPAAIGATTMAGCMPVVLATDQPALPLSPNAATATNQAIEIASLASIDAGIPAALGQTTMSASMPVTLASDQSSLSVNIVPNSGSNFIFGDVTLAVIAQAVIRRNAYIEQTTNAQRSLVSTSALDTAAGTGARTVRITYYTATFTGPFTETVTLNGVTPVNTVSSTICYIEKIDVMTAGSTGSNAGVINLKAATAGGGVTIGFINALENQTFWVHHYIATGKTCNITGISVSHNGTTVGSGGVFVIKSKSFSVSDAVEVQVSGFVRLYGQSSNFARVYQSPLKIVGPSRLFVYVTPETSSSTVYRAAVDFYES